MICLRQKCGGELELAHENIINHHASKDGVFATYTNKIYWCKKCKTWMQTETKTLADD